MNAPAPFDVLLDAIGAAIGVPCVWGTKADAAASVEARVVFVPPERGGISLELCPFGLPGLVVIGRKVVRLDVHFYATSEDELLQLYGDVGAQLDILAGPTFGRPPLAGDPARPGYEFGALSTLGDAGDGASSATWSAAAPAALKDFVSRETRPTAPIVSVPVAVVTIETDGSNEQAAIP